MANEADLQMLLDSEEDLSGPDFQGADLSNKRFSSRNFKSADFSRANLEGSEFSACDFTLAKFTTTNATNAIFDRSMFTGIFMGDFTGARLRWAVLKNASLERSQFRNADLRGADLTNARVAGDCDFEGALSDDSTEFDGMRLTRAEARSDVFRYFNYQDGHLRRRGGIVVQTSGPIQDYNSPDQPVRQSAEIAWRIRDNRQSIAEMAVSLALLAEAEMTRSTASKPNDQQELELWQTQFDLLARLASGLRELQQAITTASVSTAPPEVEYKDALSAVGVLKEACQNWWKGHAFEVVDSTARVALLGGGTALLGLVGVPVLGAFPVISVLAGGPKVVDYFRQSRGATETP